MREQSTEDDWKAANTRSPSGPGARPPPEPFSIGAKQELKMRSIVIGGYTDAGGLVLTFENGHLVIKRIPGWNLEQFTELGAALNILREATKLKTPGLAEASAKSVWDFTQKQLDQHVKGDAVLVI
jgi:hypothetical protein